ncbi:putative oxidoreductase [Melghirimyces profundicolus]|uniref:Putative oxidoreductase n=1 Tax=Melghirimyces profundicolus TaxID=1242148 RepID=A0A2T6BCF8_9BACL|nr:DoxX family protein [Melghirimyces profundicolus]PTX53765.1 putative oxidoreductase [Melghirimyces profundicolus]
MADLGLLIIRLVFGLTLAGHGAQKLFGWFGGHGVKGTGGFFESIGIRPGVAMAVIAGLGELIGGLLFAAGVWIPVASALFVIIMLVAIAKVHAKNGYWVTEGGIEYNVAYIAVAIGLALTGPGAYTLF